MWTALDTPRSCDGNCAGKPTQLPVPLRRRAELPPGGFPRTPLPMSPRFAFAAALVFAAPALALAQTDSLAIPEITVVATRQPVSVTELTRAVTVRSGESLRALPGAVAIEDALDRLPGVTMTTRGAFGVQADLSLRGATFGQQLLVVDGQRLSDPQTGHFLLDVPLGLDDLERIEVLHGPAATLYGPDAFGGVVHLVTSAPGTGGRAAVSVGERGLRTGQASAGWAGRVGGLRLYGEGRQADSYRPNTDFDAWTAGGRLDLALPTGVLQINGGYSKKSFGTADFYASPFDPRSREQTRTALVTAALPMTFGRTVVTPRLVLRRAFDDYVFDPTVARDSPKYYEANHRKTTAGGEIELRRTVAGVDLTSVSEVSTDDLRSNKLGNRSLTRFGQGLLLHGRTAPLGSLGVGLIDLGLRADHQDTFGWQVNPAVGLGLLVGSGVKLRGAVSRSFRAPSFTERFNPGGGNLGRADLKPETGWSTEFGGDWLPSAWLNASVTGFVRTSRDVIDFVRRPDGKTYEATNIAAVDFRGVETSVEWRPMPTGVGVASVGLGYTYLDGKLDLPADVVSKYAVSHPRHQGTVALRFAGPAATALAVSGIVRQPVNAKLKGFGRWDARLSATRWGVTPYVEAMNVLDQPYAEFPGVPEPGRWVRAGLATAW